MLKEEQNGSSAQSHSQYRAIVQYEWVSLGVGGIQTLNI